MRKSAFILLVLAIMAFSVSAYAQTLDNFKFEGHTYCVDKDARPQIIRYDFDGDGHVETLMGFHGVIPGESFGISFIAIGKEKAGKLIPRVIVAGNDRFTSVDLKDIDKDGLYEIVFWSSGGAHHTDLAIYKYKKGKMVKLFDNGSACEVIIEDNSYSYRIRVGVEKFDKSGWSYAEGTDLFKLYEWDGKKFTDKGEIRCSEQ